MILFYYFQLGEVDCWEPECDQAGGCCGEGSAGEGVVGGAGGGERAPHRLELAGCAPPHCPACMVRTRVTNRFACTMPQYNTHKTI